MRVGSIDDAPNQGAKGDNLDSRGALVFRDVGTVHL